MYSLERGAASWRSSWKIDAGSGNGASPGERRGVWKMKKKVGRHQAGRMGRSTLEDQVFGRRGRKKHWPHSCQC